MAQRTTLGKFGKFRVSSQICCVNSKFCGEIQERLHEVFRIQILEEDLRISVKIHIQKLRWKTQSCGKFWKLVSKDPRTSAE